MPPTPEPFSRILIDKALEASGWNLLDPQQVRFEVHAGGKRADLDPYDAKEQARSRARLDAGFQALHLRAGVCGRTLTLSPQWERAGVRVKDNPAS